MSDIILVAVSSGPDSMALLHKLQQAHEHIVVAHVNYHQRKTSMRDEKTIRDYASLHQLPFEMKDFDQEVKGNFQKVARDFRYAFFKELYEKYDAKALYLGHHLDDDLETYLMQKRANRISEYPGINKETTLNNMLVKRPLLHLSKEALIAYCHENQVPYEIDESNLTLDYTRNQIRHDLSSLSNQEKEVLIHELHQEKREKEAYLASLPQLSHSFLIQDYQAFEKDKRLDALRIYLEEMGVKPYAFSRSYMEALDEQILNGKAQIDIQDFRLSVSYGEVMLHQDLSYRYTLDKNESMAHPLFRLAKTGKRIEGVFLRDEDYPITIRSAQSGDQIKLRFGTKKLNRFFIDRKIPIHQRKSWPVIENSMKELVFVVGIGCDIHHYANNPSVFMIKL